MAEIASAISPIVTLDRVQLELAFGPQAHIASIGSARVRLVHEVRSVHMATDEVVYKLGIGRDVVVIGEVLRLDAQLDGLLARAQTTNTDRLA